MLKFLIKIGVLLCNENFPWFEGHADKELVCNISLKLPSNFLFLSDQNLARISLRPDVVVMSNCQIVWTMLDKNALESKVRVASMTFESELQV